MLERVPPLDSIDHLLPGLQAIVLVASLAALVLGAMEEAP